MRSAILIVLAFVAVLWAVEVVNGLMDHRLSEYGIVPRTRAGLIGIPLAPFLHGGFGHLLSNTVPLLMLGSLAALQGRNVLMAASLLIIGAGGAAIWIAGRGGVHVGASSLVFGLFGYLVARGWYDRRLASVLIAIGVLALYWGLLFGVLPTQEFVSWEGHLFGLLAGVLAARLSRRKQG